jgi:archaea-specific DNA-binding protein
MTEVTKVEDRPKKNKAENVIFVGDKPTMSYVTAVIMQFNVHNQETVLVCSRGKFISKVVDIIEIVKNRFMKDVVETKEINTGSEEFVGREGKPIRVSTIEAVLIRKKR